MNAGKLNRRVVIEQRTATVDALGQPLEMWSTVATVWGDVRHQRGLESLKADATTSVVRASVRIRYRADVNAGMRLVQGSTRFNVIAVLPQGNEALDLLCEVVN